MLYGAGGSGKSALLSKTALQSLKEWLSPAVPLLMVSIGGIVIFNNLPTLRKKPIRIH